MVLIFREGKLPVESQTNEKVNTIFEGLFSDDYENEDISELFDSITLAFFILEKEIIRFLHYILLLWRFIHIFMQILACFKFIVNFC